ANTESERSSRQGIAGVKRKQTAGGREVRGRGGETCAWAPRRALCARGAVPQPAQLESSAKCSGKGCTDGSGQCPRFSRAGNGSHGPGEIRRSHSAAREVVADASRRVGNALGARQIVLLSPAI